MGDRRGGCAAAAPQQKRRALGGEPHTTFELEQQLHCGWWAPCSTALRFPSSPPPPWRPSHGTSRLAASSIRRPFRAARGTKGQDVPLRAVRLEAVSPPDPGLGEARGAAHRGGRGPGGPPASLSAARQPGSASRPPPNPRLLLTGAWARRPAAGYVCRDGGGRRRPPQQKRRALGGGD